MNWYKLSKKDTAPIPENFDIDEKSEEHPKWEMWSGGNDWEISNSLMSFEIEEITRVWAEISYDHLKNFKNSSGENCDKELDQEAVDWGQEAVNKWLEETQKNYDENSEKYYEWRWLDSCVETAESKAMKPYIKDWGIDEYKWVPKDVNKVKKSTKTIKESR